MQKRHRETLRGLSVCGLGEEGGAFYTQGVKHCWNWRGQPEVDGGVQPPVTVRHSENPSREEDDIFEERNEETMTEKTRELIQWKEEK